MLELHQVSLTTAIGFQYLLRDISFSLHQGDRLVIIGPSGAGKTSLLRLLNRLGEPTEGKITFHQQPIQATPILQLRSQVVLVPQEPKLLGMSVQETLTYPLRLQKLPTPEIKQRLSTWIERLNIAEQWLTRNELQLSLGQRQLVAIARGMMMQPQILLLDEPTSALDSGRSNNLLTILNQLTQEEQLAIILITHDLKLAQKFATQVIYLENGHLQINSPASTIDWQKVEKEIMAAETRHQQEW